MPRPSGRAAVRVNSRIVIRLCSAHAWHTGDRQRTNSDPAVENTLANTSWELTSYGPPNNQILMLNSIVSTKMACTAQGVMVQEQQYFRRPFDGLVFRRTGCAPFFKSWDGDSHAGSIYRNTIDGQPDRHIGKCQYSPTY